MNKLFGAGPESQERENPEIPQNIFFYIMSYLPINELISSILVSRTWSMKIKKYPRWRKMGANSYEDFVLRFQLLDTLQQKSVLANKYDLTLAEKIQRFTMLNNQQKKILLKQKYNIAIDDPNFPHWLEYFLISALGIQYVVDETLTSDQIRQFKGMDYDRRRYLLTEGGLHALGAGMYTVDEVLTASSSALYYFLTAYEKSAFAPGLLSLAQVEAMAFQQRTVLLSEQCIAALSNNILTFEQALTISAYDLSLVVSERGMQALSDDLFTIEDVLKMPEGYLRYVLSEWGQIILAPNNKLLTIEDIKKLQTSEFIRLVLSEWAFNVLSNEYLSKDQLLTATLEQLRILLSENGVAAFRDGRITAESVLAETDPAQLRSMIAGVEEGASVEVINPKIFPAIASINDYLETLKALNLRLPSTNNNKLRQAKGEKLRELFSHGVDSTLNEKIRTILGDKNNSLIQNSSKLPFKFFKVKSHFKGYRNPLLDNRLCESETEARLVQYYHVTSA